MRIHWEVLSHHLNGFSNVRINYYFQYGLNLSKLQSFELNSAFVGTIQHAVLKIWHRSVPKGYPKNKQRRPLCHARFMFSKTCICSIQNPSNNGISCRRECWENLMVTFERLNPMEDDTDFEIKHQEYKFSYTWPTRHEIPIALKGIIDRIDMTPTTFRIVDYKSSAKRLKKDKVLGGLQLQLLTYLIITSKTIQQKLLSERFYLSMRNLDVSVPRYKIAKKEVVNVDVEQYDELIIKKHKLTGWFCGG
jgi:ATP-dependent helicase/nuclease subunit B